MSHQRSDHGYEVLYRPANPLGQSDPPIPPFEPGTRIHPVGSVNAEGAFPLPTDIEVWQDMAIPLRDGVTLYGDVYRKSGVGPVPVILVYTPYVKRGGYWNTTFAVTVTGVPADRVSGLQPFEAVDPGYWCDHGYAVAVVDARGTGHSEGDMAFKGTQAGRDVHDVIEWIAEQDWSTGKIAMTGNSQLASLQWAAAAERPPHLSAIAPWEGLTDLYRDVIARGGIPDYIFHDVDIIGFLNGKNRFEDVTAMHRAHPLNHPYWEDKRPELAHADVPAYVVASWTHPIHSRSTIKAFETLGSKDKWLRVHNTQEWPDLYDPANVEDLRRFFDHYLKGADNGWEQTPRARYAMLDPGGEDVFRTAGQWPPVQAEPTTLYLDAATGTLTAKPPEREASVSYDSTDPKSSARFTYTVEEESELIGPSNLRLWVESSESDDLDLFGVVYKTDANGKARLHIVFPAMKELFEQLIAADADLPGGPLWPGPSGRLRASHRALDPERSTDLEPFLTHAREELIEPGTPVEVDLGLWPAGMLLHKGETLVVEIAGHVAGPIPAPRASEADPDAVMSTRNAGTHTIRTGGSHDSKVFLPLRAAETTTRKAERP